jgi:hypothetical protein
MLKGSGFMAYCFMSTEKIKSIGSFTRKMNHNYRLTEVPNADPDRAGLNEELIKMEDASYADAFKRIMLENNHTPRSNAVLGFEVVMTYNPREVGEDFDIDKWKEENIKWLQKEFGDAEIISAVLHRDEGPVNTPAKDGAPNACHIHAVVIPMKDGKLNAKHYLSGKAKLSQLQTSYGKAMSPLGLERGMEGSVASHKKIRYFYDQLNKTFDKHLPKPDYGEDTERYYERADRYYVQNNLKHMDEINKMQRKIDEAKTMAHTLSVDEKITVQTQLQEAEKERLKLEEEKKKIAKEKEEIERIKESVKADYTKIHNFNLIVNGLKNYPDQDHAKRLSTDLNKLIRWESEVEKDNAKELKIIKEQEEYNKNKYGRKE